MSWYLRAETLSQFPEGATMVFCLWESKTEVDDSMNNKTISSFRHRNHTWLNGNMSDYCWTYFLFKAKQKDNLKLTSISSCVSVIHCKNENLGPSSENYFSYKNPAHLLHSYIMTHAMKSAHLTNPIPQLLTTVSYQWEQDNIKFIKQKVKWPGF